MGAVEGNVQRAAAAAFANTAKEEVVANGATEWEFVSIKNSRADAGRALRCSPTILSFKIALVFPSLSLKTKRMLSNHCHQQQRGCLCLCPKRPCVMSLS